jgi:hypothetical protein
MRARPPPIRDRTRIQPRWWLAVAAAASGCSSEPATGELSAVDVGASVRDAQGPADGSVNGGDPDAALDAGEPADDAGAAPDGGSGGDAGCQPNACTSSACCELGQTCSPASVCEDDRRGPYCEACGPPTPDDPLPCDAPENFCLNEASASGGSFCGVDCSGDQPCPNGYQCSTIGVRPLDLIRCTRDESCPDGRECAISEGQTTGVCGCSADSQCPGQPCDPRRGVCVFTGQSCTVGGEPCPPLPCVDGLCFIGRNCVPGPDLTCDDLTR